MLKKLGLLFPSLSRLHDERNRYAASVEALTSELATLREYENQLKSMLKGLGSQSMTAHVAPLVEVQNVLQAMKIDISNIGSQINKLETSIEFRLEDMRRECFSFVHNRSASLKTCQVKTEHPVAMKSDDHIYPRGTRNDNTRYPRFVHAAERAIGKNLRVLELGCAGGGLVLDFVLAGHDALGIEGSDYSEIWRRAEWANIPERLFTADITKAFHAYVDGEPQKFDLITAWEVLEHIHDSDMDGLFDNIRRHLAPNGIFCGSVATFEDCDSVTGAIWHVTVKPRDWWVRRIADAGFEIVDGLFTTADYPRGSGNPRAPWDWDAAATPEMGFHICFKHNEALSLI